jgi:Flp pilus assembly protein TadG
MTTHSARSGAMSRIAAWRRDRRGVAAVEFALILPILITFYLGLTELQPGISIKRKLTLVTRTLADLTTRSSTLATADLKDVFGAATTIMRPYDTAAKTQMAVTSVAVIKNGSTYTGKVLWSCDWNPGSGADDVKKKLSTDTVTVPPGFQTDGITSFILVETKYPYSPTIGYTITGTISLKDSVPWPVRDADQVVLTPTAPAGCPAQT